jgi:IrrE N-terminal-like domain
MKNEKTKWVHKSVVKLMKESGNNDPVTEIKARARNLVVNALDLGWEGPPYSPIELAKLLNIDLLPNDSVTDARLIPIEKGHLQIQYNPFQKPTRINFSVAHEIAHTLFSDCEETVRNREDDPNENRQLEQLCNAGAAEIQLPYAIFSNDANAVDPTINGLIELAGRYKASLESVFIRYAEVINKPCAILIGIFDTDSRIVIDYFKSSKYLKIQVPDNFVVPSSSKAYECVSPGWTARETNKWEIFADENFDIYSIGISAYKRDNKPRVGILVLPTKSIEHTENSHRVFLEFGDATKPRGTGVKIIAQVVNTSGGMGIGFGKSLSRNYPIVKTELEVWVKNKNSFVLGNSNLIQVSKSLYVFQMLAQKGLYPKDNEIPLKYNELRKCLIALRAESKRLKASVHMPQIGSGQAHGDWNIILGMIYDELVNLDVNVNIYVLPGKAFNPKIRSNLTLFKETSTWETGKLF